MYDNTIVTAHTAIYASTASNNEYLPSNIEHITQGNGLGSLTQANPLSSLIEAIGSVQQVGAAAVNIAATVAVAVAQVAVAAIPAVMRIGFVLGAIMLMFGSGSGGGASGGGTGSGNQPYKNPIVDRAIREINSKLAAGADRIEVSVGSRADAENLFYQRFYGENSPSGQAYTNTSDMGGGPEAELFLGRQNGTYHWDVEFDPVTGKIIGHEAVLSAHGSLPHLQIRTWDGVTIRILWPKE